MRRSRADVTDVITDDASAPRARRGDVLTGPERRRRWPLRRKLEIVAESFEPGAVVSHVAQRHGLKPQQLFDWRRQVRAHLPNSAEPPAPAAMFTPVVVAERPARAAPEPAAPVPSTAAMIEIAIGSAAIRVSGAVDAKALAAVLRAVKAAT